MSQEPDTHQLVMPVSLPHPRIISQQARLRAGEWGSPVPSHPHLPLHVVAVWLPMSEVLLLLQRCNSFSMRQTSVFQKSKPYCGLHTCEKTSEQRQNVIWAPKIINDENSQTGGAAVSSGERSRSVGACTLHSGNSEKNTPIKGGSASRKCVGDSAVVQRGQETGGGGNWMPGPELWISGRVQWGSTGAGWYGCLCDLHSAIV